MLNHKLKKLLANQVFFIFGSVEVRGVISHFIKKPPIEP